VNSGKIHSGDLWLLRLEIVEGWKVETTRAVDVEEDTWHHIQNSRRKQRKKILKI
jgi:hypothetical protein